MASEITVPRLGWTMDEGVLVGWLKKDGDAVVEGEPIFTLEGDKVTEDVGAIDSGILRLTKGSPSPGDVVMVGAVVAYLVSSGEEIVGAESAAAVSKPPATPTAPEKGPGGSPEASAGSRTPEPATGGAPHGHSVSPRAASRARELGVDVRKVAGSGRSGRVRERDVVEAARGAGEPAVSPGSRGLSIRRTIATRMARSARNTAAATLTTTAEATRLVEIRQRLRAQGGDHPTVSFNDLVVAVVAVALREHPDINAWWVDEDVVPRSEVNIGIAVDLGEGLRVPVIREADTLKVRDLSARTRELIDLARAGELSSRDVADGSFTITNLGMYDIDVFTPIIYEPQVAILGVGRIREQARVLDGEVVVRPEVTLSLTIDHRAVDGVPAAGFLRSIRTGIESPDSVVEE